MEGNWRLELLPSSMGPLVVGSDARQNSVQPPLCFLLLQTYPHTTKLAGFFVFVFC